MFKTLITTILLFASLSVMAQTYSPISAPSWSRKIAGSDTTWRGYSGGFYEFASRPWVTANFAPIAGGGYVPTSRTLTVFGTTFDLSANRTFTASNLTNGYGLSSFSYNGSAAIAPAVDTTVIGSKVWANGRFLTQSSAASTYQPLNAKLTAFSALANGAGVFTNDGSGGYSWAAYSSFILNKYGSTTPQASSKIIVTDTIRTQSNVIVQPTTGAGKFNAYGNSIQYGTGTALPITTTQAYRVANGLNLTINNQAVPGSVITDMLTTQWATIPNYNSVTNPYISTLFGTNESYPPLSITTSQYRAYYNALVDSLHTLKGYPLNRIIIMGMPYTGAFATDPRPNAEAYAAIDSIVAAEKGTLFVENFHWAKAQGGRETMLGADGVHLSDIGNASIAAHAISVLGFTLDGNVIASNNIVSALNITAPHADISTIDADGVNSTQLSGINANFTNSNLGIVSGRTIYRDSALFSPAPSLGYNIGNRILFQDGGTSDTRMGMGVSSSNLVFYTPNSSVFNTHMYFGQGVDPWTINSSNSALEIYQSHVTLGNNLYLRTAPPSGTAGMDLLLYDSGESGRVKKITASSFAPYNGTMYIGTTAVNLNRSSLAQTLTGINIDGTAGNSITWNGLSYANSLATSVTYGMVYDGTSGGQRLASDTQMKLWLGVGAGTSSQITLGNNTYSTALPNGTTATTQTANDNSTKVATTAYVDAAIAASGLVRLSATSSSSISLVRSRDYSFNGTTATWTLPTISTELAGGTYSITIKNRGSGNLTINSSGGGNDIYTTSAVSTETIAPGAAVTYIQDLTYWNHE